jgi:CO dehydrogenase/acetyl-CoA synthase epsilon subunit
LLLLGETRLSQELKEFIIKIGTLEDMVMIFTTHIENFAAETAIDVNVLGVIDSKTVDGLGLIKKH